MGSKINMADQVFKKVFGSMWEKLPPVFQKRYNNRPFSNDTSTVEGTMDISLSKFMSCFMPFFKLLHVLVPYQGHNVPVTVDFRSRNNANAVYLDRTFYFPGKKPYQFNSCMQPIHEGVVIEYMAFGLGWKTHYFFDGMKVIMQHKGYVWKVGGINVPLPLEIFIGKGHAEEEVINDNTYRVTMTMTHPLLGLMYSYMGNFTFTRLS